MKRYEKTSIGFKGNLPNGTSIYHVVYYYYNGVMVFRLKQFSSYRFPPTHTHTPCNIERGSTAKEIRFLRRDHCDAVTTSFSRTVRPVLATDVHSRPYRRCCPVYPCEMSAPDSIIVAVIERVGFHLQKRLFCFCVFKNRCLIICKYPYINIRHFYFYNNIWDESNWSFHKLELEHNFFLELFELELELIGTFFELSIYRTEKLKHLKLET
jgi:hypothetical protein